MDRTNHELATVGMSILTVGFVVPVAAAITDPIVLVQTVFTVPIGEFIGPLLALAVLIGLLLAPAALFARWDMECRLSFRWVVIPTAFLTSLVALASEPLLGMILAVPAYLIACAIVGVLALPRRRRLTRYITGRCTACGYDVRGLEGPKCPECGKVARVRPRVRVPLGVHRG